MLLLIFLFGVGGGREGERGGGWLIKNEDVAKNLQFNELN